MHGGGGGTGPGGVKRARIEIIPLIDVIFFLLATFVLFTLALNKSNGVKVNLPASSSGEAFNPEGVTISVTDEGAIAWNADMITLDEFQQRLLAEYKHDPEVRILINGDEKAFFAQAIYVFDVARKAGFKKVFIETRSR